jgi:uncharacterized SAM-binding protein YcdF (DUF218 family)
MIRGRSKGNVWWWFLAVLLPLLIAGGLFFPYAGSFLVVEDRFDHADLALVLSGETTVRTLAARDLYNQGRVDQILVIPDPPSPIEGELVRLDLIDPSLPPWPERILIASGVPASQIGFLPEPADGTIQEAQKVRKFLKGRLPASLVVVTSKYASRRARFIFRIVLKDTKVTVLSYPSPYDPFEAKRWWVQPRNALRVAMEYQKFLSNAATLLLDMIQR